MQAFLKQDQKILYHQAQLNALMGNRDREQGEVEKQAENYVLDLFQRALIRNGLIPANATWVPQGAWYRALSREGVPCDIKAVADFRDAGESFVTILFRDASTPAKSKILTPEDLGNPQKLKGILIDFATSLS